MRLGIVALVSTAVVAAAIAGRHVLLVALLSLEGAPPLDPPGELGPTERWADDYFTVEELGPGLFAIGEPRYLQRNFDYLVVGEERAVLFDAGAGRGDIRPVVASLTDRPLLFVPSHFHYDHVGNGITFDRVAIVDLPELRERAPDDRLTLTWQEHLGAAEGYDSPTFEVAEWIAPNAEIDLGGRSLEVLYTPGHTWDSISLYDRAAGFLLAGDFIYEGPLFAFTPTSSLGDYAQGAATVLGRVEPGTRLFGAHRMTPPGAPELDLDDVRDLRRSLEALARGELEGEGVYPVSYPVNDSMDLLAEPAWLQRWAPSHPEFAE